MLMNRTMWVCVRRAQHNATVLRRHRRHVAFEPMFCILFHSISSTSSCYSCQWMDDGCSAHQHGYTHPYDIKIWTFLRVCTWKKSRAHSLVFVRLCYAFALIFDRQPNRSILRWPYAIHVDRLYWSCGGWRNESMPYSVINNNAACE